MFLWGGLQMAGWRTKKEDKLDFLTSVWYMGASLKKVAVYSYIRNGLENHWQQNIFLKGINKNSIPDHPFDVEEEIIQGSISPMSLPSRLEGIRLEDLRQRGLKQRQVRIWEKIKSVKICASCINIHWKCLPQKRHWTTMKTKHLTVSTSQISSSVTPEVA